VEGDKPARPGHAISQAIADAGINMDFVVAQVVGRKLLSHIWFRIRSGRYERRGRN